MTNEQVELFHKALTDWLRDSSAANKAHDDYKKAYDACNLARLAHSEAVNKEEMSNITLRDAMNNFTADEIAILASKFHMDA